MLPFDTSLANVGGGFNNNRFVAPCTAVYQFDIDFEFGPPSEDHKGTKRVVVVLWRGHDKVLKRRATVGAENGKKITASVVLEVNRGSVVWLSTKGIGPDRGGFYQFTGRMLTKV